MLDLFLLDIHHDDGRTDPIKIQNEGRQLHYPNKASFRQNTRPHWMWGISPRQTFMAAMTWRLRLRLRPKGRRSIAFRLCTFPPDRGPWSICGDGGQIQKPWSRLISVLGVAGQAFDRLWVSLDVTATNFWVTHSSSRTATWFAGRPHCCTPGRTRSMSKKKMTDWLFSFRHPEEGSTVKKSISWMWRNSAPTLCRVNNFELLRYFIGSMDGILPLLFFT